MEADIYRAPQADLREPEVEGDHEFYVVGTAKFLILMIGTFGLYELYWFYKNWSQYKFRHGENLLPVMRAIFSMFFVYSLLKRVAERNHAHGQEVRWFPGWMAASYILLSVMGWVAEAIGSAIAVYTVFDFVSLATFPAIIWILYCAQQEINMACGDPDGDSNATLTPANYFWILIGVLIWAGMAFEFYAGFSGRAV